MHIVYCLLSLARRTECIPGTLGRPEPLSWHEIFLGSRCVFMIDTSLWSYSNCTFTIVKDLISFCLAYFSTSGFSLNARLYQGIVMRAEMKGGIKHSFSCSPLLYHRPRTSYLCSFSVRLMETTGLRFCILEIPMGDCISNSLATGSESYASSSISKLLNTPSYLAHRRNLCDRYCSFSRSKGDCLFCRS
jgi:hypothetical protein